jgi:ADP-dependent NAD(P)H-hydrate dehydratase
MPVSHRADQNEQPTTLDASLLRAWPLPLDEHGDKLTRGTVLVIAGSTTTAGAALLAGTAALRMGAGRLQIATAEPISMGLSIAMPEAMVLPIPVDDECELLPDPAVELLTEPVENAQAILIGPGMTGLPAIRSMMHLIADHMAGDAVLVADAAALQAITSTARSIIRSFAKNLVLTPNRDELERVVDALGVDDASELPALAAARELGAVITCFGEVTSFDERRWRAETATPGLGTSGSGDVLAGLVAGAAARSGDPAQAACWATYVHHTSASRLSERVGTTSFIARELLDEAPSVLAKLD